MEKGNQVKTLKAELAKLRSEFGVLDFTTQVLTESESAAKLELQAMEAARGIAGYSETQEKLDAISEKKSELDQQKGKTLMEVSKLVADINDMIALKKTQLAPLVENLKALRATHQEVEGNV